MKYTDANGREHIVQKELKAYVDESLHHAFMVRCRTNKRTMAEVLFAAAQAYANGDVAMTKLVEKYQR